MARLLWVVQYFVANGMYVLLDYHPEPGNVEPVTESVDMFSNNWLRLWSGLTCLPNFKEDLQGRVFLDLMNGEHMDPITAYTMNTMSLRLPCGLLNFAGQWL
jgi:hypothetical protein